jgi:hypothetical protein
LSFGLFGMSFKACHCDQSYALRDSHARILSLLTSHVQGVGPWYVFWVVTGPLRLLLAVAVLLPSCGGLGVVPLSASLTEASPPSSPPGPEVTDPKMQGHGACAERTVEEARNMVHAHWRSHFKPRAYKADTIFDIYAFATDTGFSFAVHHGAMDCPEGCLVNEYWYYETDRACEPLAFDYHAVDTLRFPECRGRDVVGSPRWGVPEFGAKPRGDCNTAAPPARLSGTYRIRAFGKHTLCEGTDDNQAPRAVNLGLTMQVEQGWWPWRDEGTVTVTGTGDSRIDGQQLEAHFVGKRLAATGGRAPPGSRCETRHRVELSMDFESDQVGKLSIVEGKVEPCSSGSSCQGNLEVLLTLER